MLDLHVRKHLLTLRCDRGAHSTHMFLLAFSNEIGQNMLEKRTTEESFRVSTVLKLKKMATFVMLKDCNGQCR